MDESYTALQRLLVIRAVRGDKLMQLTTIFINNTLGKKYLTTIHLICGIVELNVYVYIHWNEYAMHFFMFLFTSGI